MLLFLLDVCEVLFLQLIENMLFLFKVDVVKSFVN